MIGIGIYTPAEARRLTGVASAKIRRWLRGHRIKNRLYDRLWTPQIDIGDDEIYLGFRDLTEIRVVEAFIAAGLSAQKVRRAIEIARKRYGLDRPLSTNSFRTDGKQVFLLLSSEGEDKLVDVFKDQYAIKRVIEPSFKGLEFNKVGEPTLWHIARGVVIDPDYSFGQPVEKETLVPTQILAAAVDAEGSPRAAAKAYQVPLRAVNHAVKFERDISSKLAA
ncbi:MAG: hypothetical protein AAF724_15355 [Pseudomonadota bacterium]